MTTKVASQNDAVFLYMGILDAYEAISKELVGENVLEEEVLPRMIYYVRNFLPDKLDKQSEEDIISELKSFIENLREEVYSIQMGESRNTITMDEIWELRAAIFGFESVFLEILGSDVIEEYVNRRVGEILANYLPDIFSNKDMTVGEKLEAFSEYIKKSNFVKDATFSLNNGEVEYRVNRCAFATIHNSSAYLEENTRYCPWGMISAAIVAGDGNGSNIRECRFTTKGSITELEMYEEQ